MKKKTYIVLLAAIVMIVAVILSAYNLIYFVDYDNLSWSNNSQNYIRLLSTLLLIIGMIFTIKSQKLKGQ